MKEGDRVFYLTCQCGCGDMMELTARDNTLYARWFRGGAGAEKRPFLGAMKERMQYLSGNRLLRELLVSREDLENLKSFLESVEYSEEASQNDSGVNIATIKPMHLMEDIYALWLEGSLPDKEVLKGKFFRMFDFEVSEMARDGLVAAIPMWIRREDWHSIPDGISPHVIRFTGHLHDKDFLEVDDVEPEENVAEEPEVKEEIPEEETSIENSDKFWCEHQGTDENDEVICLIHLAEGRVLSCPYANLEEREEAEYPCSDYAPKHSTIDVEVVDNATLEEPTEEAKDEVSDVVKSVAAGEAIVVERLAEDTEDEDDIEDVDSEDVVEIEDEEVPKESSVVTEDTSLEDLAQIVKESDESADEEEIPEVGDEDLEEIPDAEEE